MLLVAVLALVQAATADLGPGVIHFTVQAPGPNVVNVVRADRNQPDLMLEMGFPHGRRNYPSRQTTSAIASLYNNAPERQVLAAVNGSFFGSGTDITGALGTGSNIIAFPDTRTNWPTFVWTDAGDGHINSSARVTSANVTFADGTSAALDRFNQIRLADTLAFYTPDYGPSTGNTFEGVEVIVEGVNYGLRVNKEVTGRVTAVREGSASLNNTIPRDGFVLAARDGKADLLRDKVNVGDRLTIQVRSNDSMLNNASFMIDGAGWILRNGSAPTNLWTFSASFMGRHPRTVLAYNADHLFLVTIDGRQAPTSVGMSFQEMADFLSGTLGATDAVNLDGGGSTTMVVNGQLVNSPSDGSQRAVANAVLLTRRSDTTTGEHSDAFPAGERQLPWDDKFTWNPAEPVTPPPPGEATHAMVLMDPVGGVESARIGTRHDTNRMVEADVFLDYRPQDAGYERYGLFLHDNGNAAFTHTAFGGGYAYVMTYDTNSGRIHAGKVVNGALTDFLDEPKLIPQSGWRRFGIMTHDGLVAYFLDGSLLAAVNDDTYTYGFAGVAYREHFTNKTLMRGARVANFVYKDSDLNLLMPATGWVSR